MSDNCYLKIIIKINCSWTNTRTKHLQNIQVTITSIFQSFHQWSWSMILIYSCTWPAQTIMHQSQHRLLNSKTPHCQTLNSMLHCPWSSQSWCSDNNYSCKREKKQPRSCQKTHYTCLWINKVWNFGQLKDKYDSFCTLLFLLQKAANYTVCVLNKPTTQQQKSILNMLI